MGTGFCLLANQVGCVLVLTGTLGACHIIMPKVIHTLAAVDRVAVCGGQSIRQVILTAKTVAAVLRLPVDRIACNADGITDSAVMQLMSEVKGNQVEYVKVPVDKLRSYFHPDTSMKQMTETLVKAMDFYNKHLERQRQDRDAR